MMRNEERGMRKDEDSKKKAGIADKWLGMGTALGVMFGIIFDNLALWLPIGVCIGLVGPALQRIKKNRNDSAPQ